MLKDWKYNLLQRVKLVETDEQGTVIARAEYSNGTPDSYLVRYKSGDGRQVTCWWSEEHLGAMQYEVGHEG